MNVYLTEKEVGAGALWRHHPHLVPNLVTPYTTFVICRKYFPNILTYFSLPNIRLLHIYNSITKLVRLGRMVALIEQQDADFYFQHEF